MGKSDNVHALVACRGYDNLRVNVLFVTIFFHHLLCQYFNIVLFCLIFLVSMASLKLNQSSRLISQLLKLLANIKLAANYFCLIFENDVI